MAYGYNSQGQIVWQDSDTPHGGTALPTAQITGQYVAPHNDPNNPLDALGNRDYLSKMRGGSVWETIRGPAPWGMKYTANGELVPTSAWEKFDTAFNDAGIYGTLGMGAAAGAVAGGAALGGAYSGAGGGALGGASGGAGTGLTMAPEGVLVPGAGVAAGGGAGAGAGAGASTADLILGSAGAPATIGIPTTAAGGLATTTAGAGAGAGAAAGGHSVASLASSYGPLLASVFGTLYGNRTTDAEKAQAAAIEQQRKYLEYQMAKQKAQDPIQDALVRMAMGMMPTYSQNLFTNYNGLPGVTAPNPNAHYSAPGIGGGGYGGTPAGPSRR